MPQRTDCLLRFIGEINELLVKNAKNPVKATINFFDALVIECFGNSAR